jgi:hypothetical protein
MEIGALSQAISSQTAMGVLISDVLSQATELIKHQQVTGVALQNVEATAKAVDENLGKVVDIVS